MVVYYSVNDCGTTMYHVLKRIIDIVVSLVSVIILAPLFAVISLAIKLDSRGPVFFKQKRFGKNKIT